MRSDAQVSTLAEALTSARRELESQGAQLKNLEALLTEERRAREHAEERAKRYEQEASKEPSEATLLNGDVREPGMESQAKEEDISKEQEGSTSPNLADVATSRLQQRLDSMMAEMNEMKQQMDGYRQRAENAEAESEKHRKTLAEMIEKIREDDAKNASKVVKRRSRAGSNPGKQSPSDTLDGSGEDDTEEGEITIINEPDTDQDDLDTLLRKTTVQNGHTVGQEPSTDSGKPSQDLITRQARGGDMTLSHGAPAVSILTVVALGVAVMAYLNSYPKVER